MDQLISDQVTAYQVGEEDAPNPSRRIRCVFLPDLVCRHLIGDQLIHSQEDFFFKIPKSLQLYCCIVASFFKITKCQYCKKNRALLALDCTGLLRGSGGVKSTEARRGPVFVLRSFVHTNYLYYSGYKYKF